MSGKRRFDPEQEVTRSIRQVHFLDEDAVVELVMNEISKALANANASRSYSVQVHLHNKFKIGSVDS